jgi:hypothetical protein
MRPKGSRNGERSLVELTCATCGRTFQVWPSEAQDGRRKRCSDACYGRSGPPAMTPDEKNRLRREAYAANTARKDYNRRYRAENLERMRALSREWARANYPRVQATRARYREQTRDARAEAARQRNEARRARMIAAYGGGCACCGITEPTFLTLDHANGGGASERRAVNSGRSRGSNDRIIVRLEREGWPQDGRYRILCWNCQWGWRMGGCPHQRASG